MKKILITGATGFVGTTLVETLQQKNYHFLATGRTLKNWNSHLFRKNFQRIDWTQKTKENQFEKFDLACVLASQQPRKTLKWGDYYNVNCNQLENLYNSGIKRVIYVSTTVSRPLLSDQSPKSCYAYSKFIGEQLTKHLFGKYIVLKFPSIVGKNHKDGILYEFYQSSMRNEDIMIFDNGLKKRNLIHVDECTEMIVKMIEVIQQESFLGDVIEAGSEESITSMDLAEEIKTQLFSSSNLIPVDNATSQSDMIVDNAKAINYGYAPKSIKEIVQKYCSEMSEI